MRQDRLPKVVGERVKLLRLSAVAYAPGFITVRCDFCGGFRDVCVSTLLAWVKIGRVKKCRGKCAKRIAN